MDDSLLTRSIQDVLAAPSEPLPVCCIPFLPVSSLQLTPEQITQISGVVAGYINEQRKDALPSAIPLSPAQRASMPQKSFCKFQTIEFDVSEKTRATNKPIEATAVTKALLYAVPSAIGKTVLLSGSMH